MFEDVTEFMAKMPIKEAKLERDRVIIYDAADRIWCFIVKPDGQPEIRLLGHAERS